MPRLAKVAKTGAASVALLPALLAFFHRAGDLVRRAPLLHPICSDVSNAIAVQAGAVEPPVYLHLRRLAPVRPQLRQRPRAQPHGLCPPPALGFLAAGSDASLSCPLISGSSATATSSTPKRASESSHMERIGDDSVGGVGAVVVPSASGDGAALGNGGRAGPCACQMRVSSQRGLRSIDGRHRPALG